MTRAELLYTIPYLMSLILSAGIFIYAWQHRRVRGAAAFAWYVGGQTLYIAGFILEMINPTIGAKIFWDKFQWLAETMVVIIAFMLFAVDFTEYRFHYPKLAWSAILVLPLAFTILLALDPLLHLIYINPRLDPPRPFPELFYDFGPVVYIYALYIYAIPFCGIGLLVSRMLKAHSLYRWQLAGIALGFTIPVLASIPSLFGIEFFGQRDIGPIGFGIGNLVVALSLFRFRLFDVVPIARDSVVDNLADPVIVLDMKNRVVDLNAAASARIGVGPAGVIGEPAEVVFSAWPDLISRFRDTREAQTEIVLETSGKKQYFDFRISTLADKVGRSVGRVLVIQDVTKHTELEQSLQTLNMELEQRVLERTAELAQAYDTTLQGWAKALELRDKETEGHSRRVTEMTMLLARALNIPENELVDIRRGALLHDIGKMAIPDEILRKDGGLTDAERAIVAQHPAIAYELLAPIPFLKKALEIPYCHHEHFDGSGYPRGLKGDQIPLSARIFVIADVWDALLSDRPYRKAWSRERTIEYMRAEAGAYFDPDVLQVFIGLLERGEI